MMRSSLKYFTLIVTSCFKRKKPHDIWDEFYSDFRKMTRFKIYKEEIHSGNCQYVYSFDMIKQQIHISNIIMMMEGKNQNNENMNNDKPKQQKQSKPFTIDFQVKQYNFIADTHLLGNYHPYSKLHPNKKWNDPRLNVLKPDYFINKVVLDIGCNQGILTIPVAMKYHPQYIKGIDIDQGLIKKCQKNKESFLSKNPTYTQDQQIISQIQKLPLFFREKFQKNNNVVSQLSENVEFVGKETKDLKKFPKNIEFKQQNVLAMTGSEFYDCILCMNITKWLHLAFGDEGIKRLFQNIGNKLHDGGILIVEAQPWRSYKKKINLQKRYKENYKHILFKPQRFSLFLKTFGIQEIETIKPTQENKLKHEIKIFQKKGFYSDD